MKIASAFLVVLCVVATPRQVWWAFAGFALLLVGGCLLARIPLLWWISRLVIEVPFVVLAVVLPFTAGGLELGDDTVREIRRRVGLVFQDPDDQLFMPTVRQDAEFGPLNFGLLLELGATMLMVTHD